MLLRNMLYVHVHVIFVHVVQSCNINFVQSSMIMYRLYANKTEDLVFNERKIDFACF